MLSDTQAAAMEGWVVAAQTWGEASQGLVGAASELSTASRSLADEIGGDGAVRTDSKAGVGDGLGSRLRVLAGLVEEDAAGFRQRFLETAANLEQYGEILGRIRGS
jgi:hypothetical protein